MTEPIVIKIAGVEKLWRFNNYALSELAKCLGVTVIQVHESFAAFAADDTFLALAYIIHSGLVGWQKSKSNFAHGLRVEDMVSYIGELSPSDINEFNECWVSFKDATGVTEFLEQQAAKDADSEKKRLDEIAELEAKGLPIPDRLKKKK